MMNRPYIFCHMMTSLDGKIIGDYMDTLEGVMYFMILLLERMPIINIRDGYQEELLPMIISLFMKNLN